jgi:hypothetical protein
LTAVAAARTDRATGEIDPAAAALNEGLQAGPLVAAGIAAAAVALDTRRIARLRPAALAHHQLDAEPGLVSVAAKSGSPMGKRRACDSAGVVAPDSGGD